MNGILGDEYSQRVLVLLFVLILSSTHMATLGLFLVQFGFVGFVASLFCAIWKGMSRDGKAQSSFKWWLLCAAVCFILWVIGLRTYPAPLP